MSEGTSSGAPAWRPGGGAVSSHITMSAILLAVTLAFAGALIAGAPGSWRAARLRPADAMAQVGAEKPVPCLPPCNPYYRPSGEGIIPHRHGLISRYRKTLWLPHGTLIVTKHCEDSIGLWGDWPGRP
jgi:hypothetical protein